ncbi:MAG: GDP-mannose 4,6-dehydratase [Clostridiales bacterium]|nr:GDP-mannose 4,6-dehydratase [Clostridiales bacterium]
MKVLITGGAGFIGLHTCRAFLDAGDEAAIIDKEFSYKITRNMPKDVTLHIEDIREKSSVMSVFEYEKPDAVVHLAAQISVSASVADPENDMRTNILGTVNVLEACREYGVRSLVMASSAAVYGEPRSLPLTEEHTAAPLSPYGLSKLTCERYLAWYGNAYNMNCIALRYSNVYGPGQGISGEGGVAAIFADRLRSGRQPVIYGDGGQTRDFVYVGDVARANRLAAVYPGKLNGVMNIGTGEAVSVNELLSIMGGVLGVSPAPRYENPREGDIRHSRLSGEKAQEVLGWRPEWSLEDGIGELLKPTL